MVGYYRAAVVVMNNLYPVKVVVPSVKPINGAVGVDLPLNGSTDIHMFTTVSAYVNQDLECRVNVSGGQSASIGVYLRGGGE